MSEQIEKHILTRYEPIKKIGSGAYGHVWKVMDRQKKTIHALKKNFDAFQNSTDAQRTFREISFLQKFSHPNIIMLEKIIKAQNDKDIYLVFEFMDIDLYALIRENILGQRHKRYIVYQVAKALYYLHTADLVHRDIKPSNILVNQNCLAKVCDFGLVRSVDDQTESNPILTQYIATRWYRAPQILLGSKRYSKAIDIWSFGCLVGEIIRGKPFFPGNSTLNQIQRVLTWTGPPSLSDIKALKTDFGKQMLDLLSKIKPINKKQWIPHCPEDALDLLNKTLQFNPEKRYTMLDVLKHPYLQQFYNPDEIIVAKQKIKTNVNDNQKLSLKEYRALIYKQIKEKEKQQSGTQTPIVSVISGPDDHQKELDPSQKTLYKNRLHKPVRSASKEREDSAHGNYKEGRSMNIKKKYDSLLGKRPQFSRTKYVKTEQDASSNTNIMNRKKTEIVSNVNKFFNEKKKKSTSVYEQKRQSQVIARYMYKNRYI